MKKYEVIINSITNDIASGNLQLGSQLPTENQMTTQYNVSKITVTKALNILVNQGIIERTAGKGTFVKSKALPLAAKPTTPINQGLIGCVFFSGTPENNIIYQGIESILTPNNYLATIQFSNEDVANENNIISSLMTTCKGLIVFPCYTDVSSDFYYKLLCNNFPIVYIDRSPKNMPCTCILTNGMQSSFLSVQALVQKHHQNFGFYSRNSLEIEVLKERYLGFLNALHHFNLSFDTNNLILGESKDSMQNQLNCIEKLKALLDSPQRPTAIVCINDISAYDVLNCAVSMGIKVPNELSVIGNDNNAGSELVYPPLTTVGQPFFEIGQTAANELLKIIENPNASRQRIYLSPSYVERQTVSYAPSY